MFGTCLLPPRVFLSCSENSEQSVPNSTTQHFIQTPPCAACPEWKWGKQPGQLFTWCLFLASRHSREHILVMCAVWSLISSRPMEMGHRCVMDGTSGFSSLSAGFAFGNVCAEVTYPLLRLFWACFPGVVQIVEMTCKGFTGSFCFGKVGLEVSGHTIETEAFLALCFLIVVVQTGRTLAL